MKSKHLSAAFLAAALLVSLVLPAGAAESSFVDISQPAVALNADILRLMGVVEGMQGNQFQPNGTLSRAQFCAMVVQFMGKGDQVPMYTTRTIFPDVTAKHWGRGYVNLAASLTVGEGEQATPLVSGTGYGSFQPDASITLEQAATILIRVLGYTTQETGAVWPDSYMNLAKSIGLRDDLPAATNQPLTRGQGAQLFVNALRCKTRDGAAYYTTLGSVEEDTVVLAVNVQADDGTDGAIRTSSGAYLPAAEQVKPVALRGKRGALVLNERKEIVSFVPDKTESVTITLSGDAQPGYLKGGNATQYTLSGNTPVYTSDKAEGDSYTNSYTRLRSGMQVTMFLQRGKVISLYAGGSTGTSADAVVVTGSVNTAAFHQLTGGVTNFTIQKNRQSITMSDIKINDVVTYDSMTNTLIVSDLRLSCKYEDASPNAKAPETIQAVGYSFPVLQSAWDSIGTFSLGDSVSLLLTADGKVAGMAASSGAARSTAVGLVTSATTAEMFLPNGGTIALKGDKANLGESIINRLATLSSGGKGYLSASRLTSSAASAPLDLAGMRLGSYTVTAGVRIFEEVGGSAVAPLNLASIDLSSVPAEKISAYRLNSSNMVDYIVLSAVTGDAYTYGKLILGSQDTGGELPGKNRTVTVENGTGGLDTLLTGYAFQDGAFGGVTQGGSGTNRASSIIELKQIKNVSPHDFFVSQGATYLSAGGKNYPVSREVECYKASTKQWLQETTGEGRLAACRAFSSDLTVYIDPVGERVRIVVAN